MKYTVDIDNFNTKLEATDWRYSAAIVGLVKYLKHYNLKYKIKNDYILFNTEDITEERYLKFVEKYYEKELHHIVLEQLLSKEENSEEEIKTINEKLSANTTMKKVFNKIKFPESSKETLLQMINDNRLILIKETFRNKKNLYANFSNTNQLLNSAQEYCRLLGYTIDAGKKGKSIGYGFNKDSFVGNDIIEFDFIPMAFTEGREAFFINDNVKIINLINTEKVFRDKINTFEDDTKKDDRYALFNSLIEGSDFLDYDVEIIIKERDEAYFKTMFLRKSAIKVFKGFKDIDYNALCFSFKINENFYLNIQREVTNSIINNVLLDGHIERFLKSSKNENYIAKQLIKINVLMKEGNSMANDSKLADKLKGAYACAKKVSDKFKEEKKLNKLDSYRTKLISSIIFKDYDRVCQILLQLSNYSGIEFGFIYPLFDNFEENKEVAYTFINALGVSNENKVTGGKMDE